LKVRVQAARNHRLCHCLTPQHVSEPLRRGGFGRVAAGLASLCHRRAHHGVKGGPPVHHPGPRARTPSLLQLARTPSLLQLSKHQRKQRTPTAPCLPPSLVSTNPTPEATDRHARGRSAGGAAAWWKTRRVRRRARGAPRELCGPFHGTFALRMAPASTGSMTVH
jgi:hypothetical protein